MDACSFGAAWGSSQRATSPAPTATFASSPLAVGQTRLCCRLSPGSWGFRNGGGDGKRYEGEHAWWCSAREQAIPFVPLYFCFSLRLSFYTNASATYFAPSAPISLSSKIISVNEVITFNASATYFAPSSPMLLWHKLICAHEVFAFNASARYILPLQHQCC